MFLHVYPFANWSVGVVSSSTYMEGEDVHYYHNNLLSYLDINVQFILTMASSFNSLWLGSFYSRQLHVHCIFFRRIILPTPLGLLSKM